MEYALKAEDIGNSAVNMIIPIDFKMILEVIVIERVMVRIIIVMMTAQEMMGVMLQMATAVMLRLLQQSCWGCNP